MPGNLNFCNSHLFNNDNNSSVTNKLSLNYKIPNIKESKSNYQNSQKSLKKHSNIFDSYYHRNNLDNLTLSKISSSFQVK